MYVQSIFPVVDWELKKDLKEKNKKYAGWILTCVWYVQGAGVTYAELGEYSKSATYLTKLVQVQSRPIMPIVLLHLY